ncbi:hypothetical protein BCE75_10259 [Isoptericola sp. CG 20/1183]|uniref:Uncharacterized protein n=1 Tax=Isoptericola halotolerans TaxID=300560 RepID=A0ABX5EI91_9MICO|nr:MULTISPECIES: hypothetical protein [Isoptericola]MCK0117642.1 hypothetical protein [Isoptericola sp. S6320L]PRZ09351.1 hypothetical protein BCE75_10259 [Isoptericola sp. CG 20/1183]PRZ10152.1 hypothetical protein BCL65_101291 [Isoptericola halotolerans]
MAKQSPPSLPPLPRATTQGHQARHLLAVPADVQVDEVEVLAMSRFSGARWDVAPASLLGADLPAGRIAAPGEPGVLRLTRHSHVHGPYAPRGDGMDLGLPSSTEMVFDVITPRERWDDPPFPGGGDRDGIARSFPSGLPNREEERVVAWLVAAARRLGGSARLDVAALWDPAEEARRGPGAGVVLTPDPGAAVDLTVWSDIWLDPQAAHRVLQEVHPRVVLATEGADYQGPPPGIADKPLYPGEKMDPDVRRALHARADDFDIAALQEPVVLDGYGLTIDLGHDGYVTVEVSGDEVLPLLVKELPWAAGGAICYRVVWDPPDLHEAQREFPQPALVVARRRASDLVGKVAAAIQAAVGGEIADESEFLLAPEDL